MTIYRADVLKWRGLRGLGARLRERERERVLVGEREGEGVLSAHGGQRIRAGHRTEPSAVQRSSNVLRSKFRTCGAVDRNRKSERNVDTFL